MGEEKKIQYTHLMEATGLTFNPNDVLKTVKKYHDAHSELKNENDMRYAKDSSVALTVFLQDLFYMLIECTIKETKKDKTSGIYIITNADIENCIYKDGNLRFMFGELLVQFKNQTKLCLGVLPTDEIRIRTILEKLFKDDYSIAECMNYVMFLVSEIFYEVVYLALLHNNSIDRKTLSSKSVKFAINAKFLRTPDIAKRYLTHIEQIADKVPKKEKEDDKEDETEDEIEDDKTSKKEKKEDTKTSKKVKNEDKKDKKKKKEVKEEKNDSESSSSEDGSD